MSIMDDLTGDDKTLATAAVMKALAGENIRLQTSGSDWLVGYVDAS